MEPCFQAFLRLQVVGYVLELQVQGKSASTIKTDLAAIRFFHDKMSQPKYTLSTNTDLGVALEQRRFSNEDRTGSEDELNQVLDLVKVEGHPKYVPALLLARYAGLRIHKCFRIDTAMAERALRENAITVKGKVGKVQTVCINDQIAVTLREI